MKILSTKKLRPENIARLKKAGLEVDCYPFIKIEPIDISSHIDATDLSMPKSVIISSQNTVQLLLRYLRGIVPNWTFYVVGKRTAAIASLFFGQHRIADVSDTGKDLADKLLQSISPRPIIFYGSKNRQAVLPEMLNASRFQLQEIHLYQSISVLHQLQSAYKGVLFFSPSAVDSFTEQYPLQNEQVAFSVGPTTANELKHKFKGTICTAKEPNEEAVTNEVLQFFKKNF